MPTKVDFIMQTELTSEETVNEILTRAWTEARIDYSNIKRENNK